MLTTITGAGFVGYSSSHNIFYKDQKYELSGGVWENGDIISVTLDCDASPRTLNISRNGQPLPTLNVQDGTLYPWFNLYQPGSSVTLLSADQVSEILNAVPEVPSESSDSEAEPEPEPLPVLREKVYKII